MATWAVFGLAWAVGYGLARAALRSRWRDVPMTLRLGLGWAAGSAFAGMATFWAIALAGPEHRGWAVGLAMAFGLGAWLVRPAPGGPVDLARGRFGRVVRWVGVVGFAAILGLWVAHGLDIGVGAAAGGWDAWSIWTHRARYFYLAPEDWTRGFDPVIAWSHPEYPSLLPSLIVFGWLPAGRCVAASPVGIALMTQVGLLLLLVGFTRAASPRSAWPWAFGAFYATIPLEWSQGIAWQYADRPLAVFFLAGAGCLAVSVRQGRRDWLVLAGFFWGAAAFTKDEGKAALALLGVGCALATCCATLHGRGGRAVGGLALIVLGLAPGLASLAIQRHFAPVSPNLIAKMTLAPLTDPARTAQIARFLLARLAHPTTGGMWWGCGLTLVTLAPWLRRRELALLWAIPIGQLAIYGLIFQLTPEELGWHLDSALPRLLFHVGPMVFLASAWLILEAERRARGWDDEGPGAVR